MEPGPQFQQLDMFKPAYELRDGRQTSFLDRLPDEHHTSLFHEKLRESENEGLLDSVRQHGVEEPVEISHGLHDPFVKKPGRQVLSNGHHRVASAHAVDPKMLVPVRHQTEAQYDYDDKVRYRKHQAARQARNEAAGAKLREQFPAPPTSSR